MNKTSDADFKAAWLQSGGRAREVGRLLDIGIRSVYARRNALEDRLGVQLPSAGAGHGINRGDAGTVPYSYRPRLLVDGFVGRAISFSDCHWWPGLADTLAFRALLEVIKETKPKLIIGNGDLLDGARISRFGRSDWAARIGPKPRRWSTSSRR